MKTEVMTNEDGAFTEKAKTIITSEGYSHSVN